MSGTPETHGGVGRFPPDNGLGRAIKSAGIARSMVWCLTSSTQTRQQGYVPPAGLCHTFAVCCLELELMTRGIKKGSAAEDRGGLPRFVDVKLSHEERVAFSTRAYSAEELVTGLQRLTDAGYRVGCSWSGDTQSYTVSLTCRDSGSPNHGQCMTSFARTLDKAVALALYKHTEVTRGVWLGEGGADSEAFG